MSAVPTSKQRVLARTLYRSLFRWCKNAPPEVTLGHLGQWVGGIHIDSPETLQAVLRQTFRHGSNTYNVKESLQEGLDGMRLLYGLKLEDLPRSRLSSLGDTSLSPSQQLPRAWLDSVEWLPPISECQDCAVEDSHLPLFPLSGPVLPDKDNDDPTRNSMFSHLPDVPVAGMEIPLRIFEPRYRQLYQDVLSNGSKRFVVPFAHPSQPGQFAEMGWMYEIVSVEDVGDQTNGQIAYMCHHLVTRPVKIKRIINPTDWTTQFTYLRVEAEMQPKTAAWDTKNIQMLNELLQGVEQTQPRHSHLVKKLQTALVAKDDNHSLWPLVNVWISHLQMTLLGLRVEVAGKIQAQHDNASTTKTVSIDMIRRAQEPFREEMESLLLEITTLVPLLLQESPKEQCERIYERIQFRLVVAQSPSQSEGVSSQIFGSAR